VQVYTAYIIEVHTGNAALRQIRAGREERQRARWLVPPKEKGIDPELPQGLAHGRFVRIRGAAADEFPLPVIAENEALVPVFVGRDSRCRRDRRYSQCGRPLVLGLVALAVMEELLRGEITEGKHQQHGDDPRSQPFLLFQPDAGQLHRHEQYEQMQKPQIALLDPDQQIPRTKNHQGEEPPPGFGPGDARRRFTQTEIEKDQHDPPGEGRKLAQQTEEDGEKSPDDLDIGGQIRPRFPGRPGLDLNKVGIIPDAGRLLMGKIHKPGAIEWQTFGAGIDEGEEPAAEMVPQTNAAVFRGLHRHPAADDHPKDQHHRGIMQKNPARAGFSPLHILERMDDNQMDQDKGQRIILGQKGQTRRQACAHSVPPPCEIRGAVEQGQIEEQAERDEKIGTEHREGHPEEDRHQGQLPQPAHPAADTETIEPDLEQHKTSQADQQVQSLEGHLRIGAAGQEWRQQPRDQGIPVIADGLQKVTLQDQPGIIDITDAIRIDLKTVFRQQQPPKSQIEPHDTPKRPAPGKAFEHHFSP